MVSSTLIDCVPATTWAFVTTRPGADHEARALLNLAASDRDDLQRGRCGLPGTGPYLSRGGIRDRPGKLDEPVGHELQAFVTQESLHRRECRRDRRHDVGDDPNDA